MKNKVLTLIREEKGSVVTLVAIAFTVFMGTVALVSDVGLLYLKQNKVAHAMDAAALAGAQELPGNPVNAVAVAKQYAQLNGIDPNAINVTVSVDNRSLSVTSSQNINLIFAKFFGMDESTVTASAQAKVAPVKGVSGAVPFSVEDQVLSYGQEYVLKEGAGGVAQDQGRWHGWFGALDFTGGGGGASEFRALVKDGYSGTVSVGDIINTESGNMSGPTTDGVEDRINACSHFPQCTWDSFVADCPKLIFVPVVEQVDNKHVRVLGFAAFFLKGVEGQGNENNVVGYFIRETISADTGDALTNYGLQGVKLTN